MPVLAQRPSLVSAQTPLTVSAHDVPAAHDGSASFSFELRFSENAPISYRTLRDRAFTVTGGEVTRARRLNRLSNVRWEITVRPAGDGDVTLVLPATTDCTSAGAVCTGDGRMLSNRLEITTPGPTTTLVRSDVVRSDVVRSDVVRANLGPAQSASTDATLSALTVSPKNIIGFDADQESYEVGVASTVTSATVTATANDSDASVAYSTTDTDTAPGHQVSLSAGRNSLTVTVTAEDTTTTKEYTLSLNRGVTTTYGWKASDDFDGLKAASNNTPGNGVWSDGTTIWVIDQSDLHIYAYKMSDGTRDSAKDFDSLDADSLVPTGIWSDETTMWVADSFEDKIFAYKMSDQSRDSGKDFDSLDADNLVAIAIWSDGTTMWVADTGTTTTQGKIYAYKMSDQSRDSAKDFGSLPTGNDNGTRGIWSDETTMWVANQTDEKVYAYKMSDKSRDASKDFGALSRAGNSYIQGIWSDGTTMWAADVNDDKLYSYNHPFYVTSAEVVSGTSLVISFNRGLAAADSLANSAFSVKKTPDGGTEATVSLTGSPSISGKTVTLTLSTAVVASDTLVKVSYTKPTSGSNNKLVDSNSNEVAGFTDQAVASVPSQPTGLTATATGPAQIDLSWTAPTSDGGASITGYKIEVSTNGTSFTTLVASQTPTTYSHTSLSANSTWHYRVAARNSVGFGPVSNTAMDTTNVFVRNTGQDSGTTHASGSKQAQRFTTGANSPGYTLTSIEIVSADAESDDFTVEVQTVDTTSGHPNGTHAALTSPTSGFAAGTLTFTAPANITLAAGTTYAVVTSLVGTGNVTYSGTTSNNEDAGAAMDWEIEDDHEYNDGSTWRDNGSGRSLRIAVRAVAIAATAPGQPTGLSATASGQTQIDLSWSAPANDGGASISGYKIEVSSDGTSFITLVATQTATSYSHTGLSVGSTRHYRVSAINSVGAGAVSATATDTTNVFVRNTGQTADHTDDASIQVAQSFTTGAHSGGYTLTSIEVVSADTQSDDFTAELWSVDTTTNLPNAKITDLESPTSFTAGTLTFSAPSNTTLTASTAYAVVLDIDGTGSVNYAGTTSSGEDAGAATDWGITDDYYYKTTSSWGTNTGKSLRIAVRGVAVVTTVPGQPTGLSATASGQTQIDLSWSAPDSDGGASISGYKIEVSTNGTSFTDLVADTSNTNTTYSHTGLSANSTRHYRVSAINSVGTSAVSSTAMATTATATTTAPGQPTGLSAPPAPMVNALSGRAIGLYVFWTPPVRTANMRPVTSYDTRYRVGSTGAWTDGPQDIQDFSGGWTTITGLTPETEYQVQVRATNAEGDSAWSPSGSATTAASRNRAPVFLRKPVTLSVDDTDPAGTKVGEPVPVKNLDRDVLTYTMSGSDASAFVLDSSSGQITVGASALDATQSYTKTSYSVTLTVTDPEGATDSVAVTIRVNTDRDLGGIWFEWDHSTSTGNGMSPSRCSGSFGFRVIWSGPDRNDQRADEWQAEITHRRDDRVTYSFRDVAGYEPRSEMNGAARLIGDHDGGRFNLRVRGRWGSEWGGWTPSVGAFCDSD